ncbi:adenylyl-sulfate kinase, partial [Klebsiella pneumoniae]|uniref:adenylyl-sulfate kinase n=1 Tax=Klebsiella pneumoniae TaxID=573 RepID=UPI002A90CDBD
RDPKGLYEKARRGEIKQFSGIDSPYEQPIDPELHLDGTLSISELIQQILAYLQQNQIYREF